MTTGDGTRDTTAADKKADDTKWEPLLISKLIQMVW